MGGLGSGRSAWRNAGTVEAQWSLDVRSLARSGALEPGRASTCRWSGSDGSSSSVGLLRDGLALLVSFHSAGVPHRQVIKLTPQLCHFGGARTWFRCPRCDRRVARVFFSSARFICRKCARLVYRSQRVDLSTRGWWKTRKAYRALGLDPDLAEARGVPTKPRGMHWRTFSAHYRRIQQGIEMRDAWMLNPSKSLLRFLSR